MNVCLNENLVRIRLSESEFINLKSSGKSSHNFSYMELLVNINVVPKTIISKLLPGQLDIYLDNIELDLLNSADLKKPGLTLLAESYTGDEININIQIDLHK